ncbi:uncharacterized protein J3R85_001534 [Psidium guajava]|nr:uncharacterized protein J3R85_001534 [Psidium guajava]
MQTLKDSQVSAQIPVNYSLLHHIEHKHHVFHFPVNPEDFELPIASFSGMNDPVGGVSTKLKYVKACFGARTHLQTSRTSSGHKDPLRCSFAKKPIFRAINHKQTEPSSFLLFPFDFPRDQRLRAFKPPNTDAAADLSIPPTGSKLQSETAGRNQCSPNKKQKGRWVKTAMGREEEDNETGGYVQQTKLEWRGVSARPKPVRTARYKRKHRKKRT